MTNWMEHEDPSRETAEGKLMIDAAKAGGGARLKGIIYSGLPSITALSAGKYTGVAHFESKVLVAAYGRQSDVPFVDVQCGVYANNLITGITRAVRAGNTDKWTVSMPCALTTVMPIIDTERDYGLFVCRAIEADVFPHGETVGAWGQFITVEEQMKQLSEATGKQITFQQVQPDGFEDSLKNQGTPAEFIPALKDEIFMAFGEFGYFTKNTVISQHGLARKPRTWREFVSATDWTGLFE
ncbi:hypothetical protein C8F01DRAFT_1275081 [Mycena amicta]|nr:hypothetical protein C8F01DRAFT_1275081 [Mycena amicta]